MENDDRENYQLTGEGKRKRARTVDNVLEHLTENNEEAKAEIIANIIDKGGDKLGGRVLTKSKVLQNNTSLNSEETVSLIAGTRSSDFLWRQTRTAFKKVIGFSPIASAHKVT